MVRGLALCSRIRMNRGCAVAPWVMGGLLFGCTAPGTVDPEDLEPCAQADDFIDVAAGSAGANYAAPEMNVGCIGDEVVVLSNGIPSFEFVATTPNALTEQNFEWRFPAAPELAATTTAVPLGGPAAVAVDGLPIFGPTEAPEDGYRDPILDELMDYCSGHTAPGGVYHYHARPDCLFTDLSGRSHLVIGYAFDGFPILGPYTCTTGGDCVQQEELQSSWQRQADQFDDDDEPLYNGASEGSWDIHEFVEGSGDLDACNGITLDDGSYAYIATSTFPYFMGCYRGTPTPNAALGMAP